MPTCWFCENHPADQGASLDVVLKGEELGTKKTGAKEYTTYYQKKVVSVPRCEDCRSKHQRVKKFGGGELPILFFALPLVTYFGSAYLSVDHSLAIIITVIAGIVAAGLWYYFSIVKVNRILAGTRAEMEASFKHPEVRKWKDAGWTFN